MASLTIQFQYLTIILIVLHICKFTYSIEDAHSEKWTPQELADLTSPNDYLITPEFFLSTENVSKIGIIVDKIINELKRNLKCYVISSISNEYNNKDGGFNKDISRFTKDLASLINKNEERDKHENDISNLIIVITFYKIQIKTLLI